MKVIALTGRLTADPEYKEYEKEGRIIKRAVFSVANNDLGKDSPEYFDVVCWSGQADFANKYLGKGSRVAMVGSFRMEVFEKDNQKHRHFKIYPDRLESFG